MPKNLYPIVIRPNNPSCLRQEVVGVATMRRGVDRHYKLFHGLQALARRQLPFHRGWAHREPLTSGVHTVRRHKSPWWGKLSSENHVKWLNEGPVMRGFERNQWNSQESLLIERRPRLSRAVSGTGQLWCRGSKPPASHFNGDQVGQRSNKRNKWGRFVQEIRRYATFATGRRSMVMHFWWSAGAADVKKRNELRRRQREPVAVEVVQSGNVWGGLHYLKGNKLFWLISRIFKRFVELHMHVLAIEVEPS